MAFSAEQFQHLDQFDDMPEFTEEDRLAYEAEVLAEIAAELESGDHLANSGVKVVCFTSTREWGKKRKRPTEVILVTYAGITHQFFRERYPAYRGADSHAEEIYADHSDNGHDPYDLYFDAVLRAISQR